MSAVPPLRFSATAAPCRRPYARRQYIHSILIAPSCPRVCRCDAEMQLHVVVVERLDAGVLRAVERDGMDRMRSLQAMKSEDGARDEDAGAGWPGERGGQSMRRILRTIDVDPQAMSHTFEKYVNKSNQCSVVSTIGLSRERSLGWPPVAWTPLRVRDHPASCSPNCSHTLLAPLRCTRCAVPHLRSTHMRFHGRRARQACRRSCVAVDRGWFTTDLVSSVEGQAQVTTKEKNTNITKLRFTG